MKKYNIHEWVNTVLIAVVLISGLVGGNNQPSTGGVTNYDDLEVDSITVSGDSAFTGSVTVTSETVTIGGIGHQYSRDASMTAATTTVCAIQSPAATSTALTLSALFTVASTSESTITLAKAGSAYATTTSLGSATIAGDAQGTVTATSTLVDALDEDIVFGPSQWFVVGMQGGIGTFSPTGVCTATWRELD